jgi:hypothetical protein
MVAALKTMNLFLFAVFKTPYVIGWKVAAEEKTVCPSVRPSVLKTVSRLLFARVSYRT